MPHLQRLPNELLDLIMKSLSCNKDIVALSVQFRRVHEICDLATRRRYRRIRIRKDEHLNPAFEVLLSILRKPSLGMYVRHLEIDRQPVHPGEYRKVDNADCLRSLSQGDLDLVKKAARRLPCTGYDEDTFLNMLMQSKIDISPPGHRSSFYAENTDRGVFIGQAIAVLLMSVCPALESLVLGAPFRILGDGLADPSQNGPQHCTLPFPLDKFIQSVGSSLHIPSWGQKPGGPYLQEVQKIEFLPRPYLSNKWYSPCDINGCLALTSGLPKLQAISVDGMKGFPMRHTALELTPNNIQSIELHRSLIDTNVLTPLLCAPSELRNFKYSSGYIGDNEPGGSHGDVGRRAHESERDNKLVFWFLLGGILRHRATLETLEVDCDYHLVFGYFTRQRIFSRWLGRPPWSLRYRGSLKDLTALTSLDIGVRLFFWLVKGLASKPDSLDLLHELPPRLRSLTIRGYERGEDPERDSQLENLENGINSGLHPCLKEVRGIRERIPAGTCALRETWLGGEDPDFKLEDWTDYE